MSKSLIDESRDAYTPRGNPTLDDLKTGCLQRIAAATELMAKDNDRLVADRDYYKCRYEGERERVERLLRSNSALRGVITKLKKK